MQKIVVLPMADIERMSEKTEITLTVSAELTRGTNGLSLDMGKFANLVCIRTALTKRGLGGPVVRLLVARAKVRVRFSDHPACSEINFSGLYV